MQHRRIDALARALAHLLDRRETLSAALVLLFATLVAGDDALGKKKGGKGGKGGGGKGGKGKNKKKKKRKRRGGGGGEPRDCNEIALEDGPDLHGCDLREHPDLATADFTNAKLEDSVLSGADLSGRSFRGARLWRAKLDGANLQNADFDPSNENRTDIFETDFTSADLTNATLEDALYPHYAIFTGAIFCNTTMPDGQENDDDCP